jgi:hypothetical protein
MMAQSGWSMVWRANDVVYDYPELPLAVMLQRKCSSAGWFKCRGTNTALLGQSENNHENLSFMSMQVPYLTLRSPVPGNFNANVDWTWSVNKSVNKVSGFELDDRNSIPDMIRILSLCCQLRTDSGAGIVVLILGLLP